MADSQSQQIGGNAGHTQYDSPGYQEIAGDQGPISLPEQPHSAAAEGRDDSMGTPVNMSDPLYGEISSAMDQAEAYAARNREGSYHGGGSLPGSDLMCNTGADDIPDA